MHSTCSISANASIINQLDQYLTELKNSPVDKHAMTFWSSWHLSYSWLAPIAEDLIAAPVSQAYVERIFSVCGLTAGC
jgi:hypothetical protein